MGESLKFDRYARTPFQVEAVRITEENFQEVADLIGEITTEDGKTFIAINRKIIPTMGKAFVGWYLTRSGDSLRCYSAKVFKQQFMSLNSEARVTWEFPNDASKPPKRVWADGKLPSGGTVQISTPVASTIDVPNGNVTTQNTPEVSQDCPPPPPPVNPPTPGWPSDPGATNIVTTNEVRQENDITLDDGHKTVNLSVGDMAQYDPKTD